MFPVVFQVHPLNLKVTGDNEIADFDPNWAFPDYDYSFNSPMALKC